jgi:hypothetical protein
LVGSRCARSIAKTATPVLGRLWWNLFYQPFCDVFVSGDRLHARTAPLFLGDDQRFVRSGDLKADLGALDAH